jgi:glutamate racemase
MNSNSNSTPKALAPLGVFDSGVGGLSVLIELQKLLPHEDILYFADSGNCPYGVRPTSEIRQLTKHATDQLLQNGAKALVIACNTASTAAVAWLRQQYPDLPIIGMVPAVKPAASSSKSGTIAVLATQATGQAPALHEVIDRFAAEREVLIIAPPGLVELVELGQTETPATEQLLRTYLEPALDKGADAVVLGCTHFPFLNPVLSKIVGTQAVLIDSGEAVARQTSRVLETRNLLNPQSQLGQVHFFSSGSPTPTRQVIAQLLHLEPASLDLTFA